MTYVNIAVLLVFVLNSLAAIVTVFREKRDIAATWAWLLVLTIIPIFGFLIYLFVGKKISKEKIFDIKTQGHMGVDQLVDRQKQEWARGELTTSGKFTDDVNEIMHMFLEIDKSILTKKNDVRLLTNGHDKFEALFKDIREAKHHIHVEYYTIEDGRIGNELLTLLEAKVSEGLEVRVIYDALGSKGTTKKFFKHFEELGGKAEAFFGSRFSFSDFRLNFRDHRKIVVIDGKIGYIGGFNVGDQYLGESEKFGNWRDTHMRIFGSSVNSMQSRFIMDWNATARNDQINYRSIYFPKTESKGKVNIQIVSSGPDSEIEQIKKGYIKLINSAKKYIYIQTPYLIPDDSVMEALDIAVSSGVQVRIMVPSMPDHAFVYRATQYYAKDLTNIGAEIYQYNNGFLHAKTVVIDDMVASVGSANFDFRSFKLNFEANAFIYDADVAILLKNIFEIDMEQSDLLTKKYFNDQSYWLKFKQQFSRLLSPIL
ncbi:cardiolipin synthase [Dellaglioa sp. BT-FLS60]